MIGNIVFTLFISMTGLTQTAMATSTGCEANLSRISYVRLVALAYSQRLIGLAQINALLSSARPQNPLDSLTPRPETIALSQALDKTISRLGNHQWPRLKAELKTWLATVSSEQREIENVREAVRPLFSPIKITSIEKSKIDNLPFIYADQTGTYFSADMAVFPAGTKHPVWHVGFRNLVEQTSQTTSVGPVWSYYHSWMLTKDYRLRLAIPVAQYELKVVEFFERKIVREVILKLKEFPRENQTSLSPGEAQPSNWLVTKSGRALIATTNLSSIQVFDLVHAQEPIFAMTFALPKFGTNIQLFETKHGQVLLSFNDLDGRLNAFDLTTPGNPVQVLNEQLSAVINKPAWFESQDGTVYLSAQSGGVFSIFTPLRREKKYFSQNVLPAGRDENFWYHGENGHDLVYVCSYRALLRDERQVGSDEMHAIRVSVFDATTKALLTEKESSSFKAGSPWIVDPIGQPRIFLSGNLGDDPMGFLIDPLDAHAPIERIHLEKPNPHGWMPPPFFQTLSIVNLESAPNAVMISGPQEVTLWRLFNSVKH